MACFLCHVVQFVDCRHQGVAETTAYLMSYNCGEQSGKPVSLCAGIKLKQIWTVTAVIIMHDWFKPNQPNLLLNLFECCCVAAPPCPFSCRHITGSVLWTLSVLNLRSEAVMLAIVSTSNPGPTRGACKARGSTGSFVTWGRDHCLGHRQQLIVYGFRRNSISSGSSI